MRKRKTDSVFTPLQDMLLIMVEAAARLSLGQRHVYKLISLREIQSVKIGRARRIPLADLLAYIEQRKTDQV